MTTAFTRFTQNSLGKFMGLMLVLFAVWACEKPLEIGRNILPQSLQTSVFTTDTASVTFATVRLDSSVTAGDNFVLTGSYLDPALGRTSATGYLAFAKDTLIPYSVFNRFDSLVMETQIGYVYGDTSQKQTIDIFRVGQAIEAKRKYNSTESLPLQTLVGTATFSPRAGRLRIRLSNALGMEIFSKSGMEETTREGFPLWFRGLAFVPRNNGTAVVSMQMVNPSTGIGTTKLLYYFTKSEPQKTAVSDSSLFVAHQLLVNPRTGFNGVNGWHFTQVRQQLPSRIANIPVGGVLKSAQSNNEAYTQGSTPLAIKLDFPHIERFRNINGQIGYFNKVEVEITPQVAPTILPPPALFYLLQGKENSNLPSRLATSNILEYVFPEGNDPNRFGNRQPNLGVFLNDGKYIVNLTTHFNDILAKRTKNNGVILQIPRRFGYELHRLILQNKASVKLRVYCTTAPGA